MVQGYEVSTTVRDTYQTSSNRPSDKQIFSYTSQKTLQQSFKMEDADISSNLNLITAQRRYSVTNPVRQPEPFGNLSQHTLFKLDRLEQSIMNPG